MAIITWDGDTERLFELGVKHGVIYPKAANGTYPLGVAWNGLTAVNEAPEGGDISDMWADDMKYGSATSAENWKGTIEAYTYPDEFAVCDGSASIIPGAKLTQQTRKQFGFSWSSTVGNDAEGTDYGEKIHCVYNCLASPSSRNYETLSDSAPEGVTLSWDVQATSVAVTGYKPTAKIEFDSHTLASEKLAAIKGALYGTASTEPYLPSLDAFIAFLTNDTPLVHPETNNDTPPVNPEGN